MKKNNVNGRDTATEKSIGHARLPCRGCMLGCKNYDRCNGKLWRMDDVSLIKKHTMINE
ncbi:MAG: hypothetical protein ACI9D5_001888 [Candidatus Endobugula sp.]|jgi:hypothetical protein